MKNNKFKTVLGIILVIAAIITLVITAIWSTVLHFMNPDMTDLRVLIDYPYLGVIALVSIVSYMIGERLIR